QYHSASDFLLLTFTDTAHTYLSPLSLHDALPICFSGNQGRMRTGKGVIDPLLLLRKCILVQLTVFQPDTVQNVIKRIPCLNLLEDRKSTRLNSSHVSISYAVFCLKKKKQLSFFIT